MKTQGFTFRELTLKFFLVLILLLASLPTASGDPVSAEQAKAAVRGWLKADRAPLQTTLGQKVKRVETFNDAAGTILYHLVYLDPEGFVIVAADDLIEPIIGFAPHGQFDPSTQNPLGALVSNDLPGRHASVKGIKSANAQGSPRVAKSKWERFNSMDQAGPGTEPLGITTVSDVRVAPLTQTAWSQSTDPSGNACYNYYTPPNAAGTAANYVCGCVATAMAQLMRFWQYPVNGVGTASFTIYLTEVAQSRNLLGGNGSGGAYDWNDMVLAPSGSSTLVPRQAIGALCADAGVSVNMDYNCTIKGKPSGESSAYVSSVQGAMKNTFGYANAVYGENGTAVGDGLYGMVNPNLDAGCPVLFGITGTPGSHAIVCDGYGYNVSTLYHHLNLGWANDDTAWYNLPTIDTSEGTFTNVCECVYNIWTNGTGEIISGRITDSGGSPITGVVVTARLSGGGTYTATSNAQGIYALARIPSSSQYTVSASMAGYNFTDQNIATGQSSDYSSSSGNKWAVNFIAGGIQAGTFSTTFSRDPTSVLNFCGTMWDGVTASQTGSAAWRPSGGAGPIGNTANGPVLGVPNDGYLQLTMASLPDGGGANTSYMCGGVLFDDFDSGLVVAGFTFECDLRIGNGQPYPADGFSINYIRNNDPVLLALNKGDTLPQMNKQISPNGGQFSDNGNSGDVSLMEEGTQTGLSVGFDMWQSGAYVMPPTPPAVGKELPGLTIDTIGLDIRLDNTLLTTIAMPNGTTQEGGPAATAATATDPMAIETGAYDGTGSESSLFWCHFKVDLSTSGLLNVWWKGAHILTDFQTQFAPSLGRLLMAARVGAFTANIDIDNIQITTIPVQSVAQLPDLVISSITATPTSGQPGDSILVTVTVKNNGPGNAAASTTRIRLAAGTTITTSDPLLDTFVASVLTAGQSASYTRTVTIPSGQTAGSYYIGTTANADGALKEYNGYNNQFTTPFTVQVGSTPILSVTPLTPPTLPAAAGTITFNVSITGGGTMSYSASVSPIASWLHVTSGASGGNNGTVMVSYDQNIGAQRSGTIQVTASGASGSPVTVTITQAAARPPSGSFVAGFDSEFFPAHASTMADLIQRTNLRWCGYYLDGPSQRLDTGWLGQRAYLQGLGWQIAPLYVGQQDPNYDGGNLSYEPSLQHGVDDGNEAATEMGPDNGRTQEVYACDTTTGKYDIPKYVTRGQGFPSGTTVYLDWESGDALTSNDTDYIVAWCKTVGDAGYRPGVYCHPSQVPGIAAALSTPYQITAQFWVADPTEPTVPPSTTQFPTYDPTLAQASATSWQYVFGNSIQTVNGLLDVDLDVACTANFGQWDNTQHYTVTPVPTINGNVSPSGPLIVPILGAVTFTASPASASGATGFAVPMEGPTGYVVDQWLVNGVPAQSGGTNFTLPNVTADTAVQVTFKPAPPATYTLTPSATANGSISPNSVQSVASGDNVTFTALPDPSYDVDQWLTNGVAAQSGGWSFTLANVTADATVQVTFKAVLDGTDTITASPVPAYGGTLSGGGVFLAGGEQTVTAVANPGYSFIDWTENGIEVSSLTDYSFTLMADRALVANFTATVVSGSDTDAPALQITQPYSSDVIVTTNSFINLAGTASDLGHGDNGISIVTVNGMEATGDTTANGGTANWYATIALNHGTNTITVVVRDTFNNSSEQQITAVYGGLLVVTVDNTTRTYGAANPSFTGTISGVQNGDNITATYTCTAGPGSPVSGYPIVPVLNDPDGKLGNYHLTVNNGTLTVTPAPLTIAANSRSKTYGQAVTFAGTEFTANGLVGSDTVTGVTLASAGAGATAIVAGSPYSIVPSSATGTGLGNYTINYQNGALTVTPAALTVTADAKSRGYGAANPALTYTITGYQNGETASTANVTGSPTLSTTATASSSVAGGPYPITCAVATLAAPDYSFTATNGQLTVTPAGLTVTAGSQSKTYGQAVTFAGTEFTTAGLQSSETVGVVTLTSSGAAPTAGVAGSPYSIVPSAASGGTFNPANYAINYINGTLTVTPAALTVTADSTSRGYGAANPALTYTIAGYQNGENATTAGLTGTPTLSTTATASSSIAGSPYTISCAVGTLVAPNYSFTAANGQLAVTPGALTITAGSRSKTYGQTVTFAGTEFTAAGLQNSETLGTVILTSSGAAAAAGVAGSPYSIVPSAASGGTFNPANYTLTYQNGTLTLTPATLTITAGSRSKTYGQTVTFAGTEFTPVGLVNGDTVSSVTLTSAGAAATATVAGSPYNIAPSSAVGPGLGNYTISYQPGALAVIPAALTVSADDKSRAYGTTNPVFTATYSGFVDGENTNVLTGSPAWSTVADTNSPVGNYPIEITQGTLTSANYGFNFTNGTLTITPASLTVTAANTNRVYGQPNPMFTGTIAGVENGDNISAAYSTTATSASPVGTYPIVPSLVDPSDSQTNYTVSLLDGTLTVLPATPSVTWTNPVAITYGTALTSNQLNATASVPGNLVYTPTNGSVLNAGTNALSVIFVPTDTVDYSNVSDSVSLVVSPASLTVTAANTNRVYGQPNPMFTGTIAGVENGDNISAAYSTTATSASPVGTYPIVPSLVDPSDSQTNYTVSLLDGTLTVLPATPSVTWTNPVAITYGTALTSNQLNATASVPGSFVYTPTNGSVLKAVTNALSVIFTPTDTANYLTATASVSINVLPPPPTITNPVLVGQVFSVSVSTVLGANYTLEYKNAFTDPVWTAAQTLPGTGSTITLSDVTATNPTRFYRVRCQ